MIQELKDEYNPFFLRRLVDLIGTTRSKDLERQPVLICVKIIWRHD